MALPRKLKYLNMFNDGLSYMGVVESVTLPKLTRKLENYRGGGMNGAAAIDLGLDDDALTVEWSVGGLPDVALWAQYAAPGADAVPLRFAGSYQRDDTGEIVAVEVVIKKSTAARISRVKTPRPNCRPFAPITDSRLMVATLSKSTPSTWSRR
jgi:P2 family phage contractile tail tube protein